jgi:hypothetical protein
MLSEELTGLAIKSDFIVEQQSTREKKEKERKEKGWWTLSK